MENTGRWGFRIQRTIQQTSIEKIKKLCAFDTGLICDGLQYKGAMFSSIKPILQGKFIVGPAITVSLPIGDSLLVSQAVNFAQEGDVIVIDAHGTTDNAVVGDVKYLACTLKKVAGMVVDGAVRDIKGMRDLDFPVWARSVTCRSSSKNNPGEINIPICCGGVTVNPGDIIAADDEGVVVIPPDFINEVIENIEKKIKKVEKLVEEVKSGKFVTDNFLKIMRDFGYKDV